MYDTGGTLPIDDIPDGETVACLGPSLARKWDTVASLLTTGIGAGEAVVVVTTDQAATNVRAETGTLDGDAVRFVDCTGTGTDTDSDASDPNVWSVGSPADLTGVSIAVSEAVESLTQAGYDRIRIALDSVTTFSVYTNTERLYQFLHSLTGQIEQLGALGLFVVHANNGSDESLSAILSLADSRIEFRMGEAGPELRVVAAAGETDWIAAPERDHDRLGAETVRPDVETPESLLAVIDAVAAERLTLLAVNAPDDAVDRLSDVFGRLNVDITTASFPEGPSSFVLLTRGDELIAGDPIGRVLAMIDGFDGGSRPDRSSLSSLFSAAESAAFDVEGFERGPLVRASRLFEQAAWRAREGTIHAGFQRLSRLLVDSDTCELYRSLAAAGVDVHLYGEDDADPGIEGATLHTDDAAEIRDCWFVVYDGGGSDERLGALLCEEQAPGVYDGFWTHRPDLTAGLLDYLEETYGRPVPTA